jgi:PD-(D/E)XK nuclease superfamily
VTERRLYDNTRLQDSRRCMRYYFFRHVLGWNREGAPSAPLAFGGAWHAAMDWMWSGISDGLSDEDVVRGSYGAFKKYWAEAGMPTEIDFELEKELSPRTPSTGFEMIASYYAKRKDTIKRLDVMEIERPFAVPLSPYDQTLFYVGRIDKIVSPREGHIRGIEHKTTTLGRMNKDKEPKIRPIFLESFSPNSQVDGYLYALGMLYHNCNVDVWVDAALVNDKGEDFHFVPVDRQAQQLDAWLWETHHYVGQIEQQKDLLQEASEADRYMAAFPKNTSSCFNFNQQCPFLELCKARSNPLTYGDEPPPGYKHEPWDPLEHLGKPLEFRDG